MAGEERDLFGSLLPHQWLPDETLFSLCSRHHRLSGNRRASTTCRTLFGHRSQGSAHDFPSRLAEFERVTHGQLGSVTKIVRGHTILPFYLPFANPQRATEAIAAMSGPSIGSLKFQLGLLTSRFRANHPLKACRACLLEDRKRYSTAYWHRDHQLPAVWVCREHQCVLSVSDLKGTGVGRFLWVLPNEHCLQHQSLAAGRAIRSLTALADASTALASMRPGELFSSETVRATYLQALRLKGLLSKSGGAQLNLHRIGAEYLDFVMPLRDVVELKALPADRDSAAKEAARLVYAYRAGIHPVRHLTFITWLFPSFANFVDQYKRTLRDEGTSDGAPERPLRTPRASTAIAKRTELLALTAEGLTVSGAARKLGVDPLTGMAWAAAAGIRTQKRPSVVKGDLKAAMMSALKRGASKEDTAEIGGVSISSVTRLLRTEIGLRDEWRVAQFATAQQGARQRWLNATAANPRSGVKIARALQPAAYAWLYRHDREWLEVQNSSLQPFVRDQAPRIDWDSRDSQLALEVKRIGLELATTAQSSAVNLWQIYQRLPELKAKLSKLDRLPLTRVAIQAVIHKS